LAATIVQALWQGKQNRTALIIFSVVMILLWGAKNSFAATMPVPEMVLVAPQESENTTIMAGASVVFSVYFTNPLPHPLSMGAYERLVCRIIGSNKTAQVIALPVSPLGADQTMIPGKGFLKREYRAVLPRFMDGTLSVTLAGHPTNTAMFHADVFDPGQAEAKSDNKKVAQASLIEMSNYFQPFTKNLSTYKPVYFLFGVDPGIEKSSFQFSFKYRLFDFDEGEFLKEKLSLMEKIYLGYTQESFWDLSSSSAPFEDSRYMPEFFYLEDKIDLNIPWVTGFGFQTGLQHESNGRGGDASRSTNYAYIQPIICFNLWDDIYLKFAPKVWGYVGNDDVTNPDLSDYRGYFDIETKIGDPLGLALETHYRHGEKGPTWQLDLSYPMNQLPFLSGILDVYLHAQFFSGYAENLLAYDQRDDVFRLGFSIVR
jgi:outer membrane phospholipase A